MVRRPGSSRAPKRPSLMGSWVHAIVRTIDASGFDGTEMAIRCGIPGRVFSDPNQRVPEALVTSLWKTAAEATGDPAIGLKLPTQVTPATFGPLAYATLASPDLRSLFLRMRRYQSLMSDAVVIRFDRFGDVYDWTVERLSTDGPPDEGIDAFFALMALTVRGLTGARAVTPSRVSLRRPRPACEKAYEDFFHAPVVFDAEADVLSYDWREVDRKLPDGNAILAEQNDRMVADMTARLKVTTTAGRVREALLRGLPEGPTEAAIARKLGMGRSTLHAALSQEGTTYRKILNHTREELARSYLAGARYTIQEVAFLLGFSDATAFTRACKRWTGRTPGQLRGRRGRSPRASSSS